MSNDGANKSKTNTVKDTLFSRESRLRCSTGSIGEFVCLPYHEQAGSRLLLTHVFCRVFSHII